MKYRKKIEEMLKKTHSTVKKGTEIAWDVLVINDLLAFEKELTKLLHDFSEDLIGENKPTENIMRVAFREEQYRLRDKLLKKGS